MPITTLFLDVGGVLLTNGWDHHVRRRAAKNFNLDWAEMEERHRLTFEIHEEGKLTFEEYLNLVVFYEKRPFTRAQFRRFMCEQSKPYAAMIALSCFVHLRKPDANIFRLALDITQTPAQQVLYIENTPMFVQIAEGLGIRSVLHTDYKSTCAKLASFGLQHD